jgi:uncharacterized protein involved in exopolysaccharide biosynthesis
MSREKQNVWDYLTVIVKWRKLILVNFIVVCVLASIVSLILPKWYTAKATLLPPVDQTSSAFGLASILSELPVGELGVSGIRSPFDLFKAILESRSVAQAIVENYDLKERYHTKNDAEAVRTLWDRSNIEITVEGTINIEVEERNPELAAAIANSYIQELDNLNQRVNITQAKNTRVFIEGRRKEAIGELRDAEENLRDFQRVHKAISLPEQVEAAIQALADIRAKQVELEVERGVLSNVMGPTHPEMVRLQSQIQELQKQIDEFILGDSNGDQFSDGDESEAQNYHVPLSKVPSIGLELARLTRDLKIQEAIFEMLTQQYEQAKIQEAKDTPTVQVLDWAVPPEKRSKPKRKIIVLVAGFLSLFASTIYVFSREYLDRLHETGGEDYHKIRTITQAIANDLSRSKKAISRRLHRKEVG